MFFLQGMQTNSLRANGNGVLSVPKAMPMKDANADGDSSFAMARKTYMRAEVQPSVLVKKKWYGNSSTRDSSVVIGNKMKNEVGNVSLNANGLPFAFKEVKDVNNARDALIRVRHLGSAVPGKVIHKYTNAPIFY
jgi:hypothetical protein